MAEKPLGIDLTRTGTVQLHTLGSVYTQENGRKFKYSKSTAAIALGDVCIPVAASGANNVKASAAADLPIAGCWPNEGDGSGRDRAAIGAGSVYFWMLVGGDALVKAAATVVADAVAVPIGTAGTLDDTAASAANALAAASGVGAYCLTSTTAGFARVMFNG